jgi:hypothetical protein
MSNDLTFGVLAVPESSSRLCSTHFALDLHRRNWRGSRRLSRKERMQRQFDKTDQVPTPPATVAVEKVFLRINVERGMGFLMQGTQSQELAAGADLMPGPMVPLQVLQKGNAFFDPFQVLTHVVGNPSRVRV